MLCPRKHFDMSGKSAAAFHHRARPHNNEYLLDRLVEVLERPDVLVAVDRLQRGGW